MPAARAPIEQRLKSALRGIRQKFFQTAIETADTLNVDQLKEELSKTILKERRAIVMSLLGLRQTFKGELEVDWGVNAAHAPIQKFINEQLKNAIALWVKEELTPLFTEATARLATDEKFKAAIHKEFARMFEYRAEERARELASEMGKAYANDMYAELCKAMNE